TPLDMLLERETNISPRVFLLPPVVFGTPPRHRARSPAVGHDVPALAELRKNIEWSPSEREAAPRSIGTPAVQ
ncbi:MAG TPA: hypothetical protein VM141_12545, partial [Planctomycetota bacterium]|nr:hypothetical protein [Planctomycetota bacterium]